MRNFLQLTKIGRNEFSLRLLIDIIFLFQPPHYLLFYLFIFIEIIRDAMNVMANSLYRCRSESRVSRRVRMQFISYRKFFRIPSLREHRSDALTRAHTRNI